ncbi:MAG TPA: MBL fold metallo-hydrolase [Actinomycetota bacterium]
MDGFELDLVVTLGLGDNSYVLSSGGEAILVDPQRDAERLLGAAEDRRAEVRYVLETHVHNDYVSGAAEVRASTGAAVVGPAAARYRFPYAPMAEDDELRIGAVTLVAMETPGHTPEHLAYALIPDGRDGPVAVFTGGSLIVGSAGRTDLLGPEWTDRLTRAQFRTLRRLGSLPGSAQVLPTHGAGSFCATAAPQEDRTSTIERELASNPVLAEPDEEAFVRRQLSGLMAFPTYYANMAPINRAGPSVSGGVPITEPISPQAVAGHAAEGAWIVDVRDGSDFAAAHIPGSLNIPLEESFASYVGWLLPFDDPLVLVAPEPPGEAVHEATRQLFRIGYERVLGSLRGGIEAWRRSGRELRAYPVATLDQLLALAGREVSRILDVRQAPEWEAGHLDGSRHVFVGDLPERLDGFEHDREVVVACASGYRSSMAASLLDRAGVPVRVVARRGVPDALRRRAGLRSLQDSP